MILQALLLGFAAARAECPDPDLDAAGLDAALADATRAFDEGDLPTLARTMNALASSMPCLDSVPDRTALARFARLMGMVAFYGQEEELSVRWGIAARLIDPKLGWRLVDDHPYRELIEEAALPPLGRAEGSQLVPPPNGAVFVDGALALEPTAHAEVTHFVQLLDKSGAVVEAWWQDGSVFPERVLAPGEGPYRSPAWYVDGAIVAAKGRATPKSPNTPKPAHAGGGAGVPVVPLVVSGGLAATSAITYLLAGAAQASLADQTDAQGLTRARSTANAYALASGLTFAGAVGVGVGGVLLSAQGVQVQLRF